MTTVTTDANTGEADAPRYVHPEIDTTIAHPARVYDFWLGGKDNFAVDREAGQAVLEANPGILPGVRSNRAFLVRAVKYLVGEAGVRQILDVGTGLPSVDNVHEVAQSLAPETKVVYVDNDPIVLVHAHALLTGEPGTIDYIDADLRNPEGILQQAERTLDFTEPVALMFLMTLQFVHGKDDPYRIVADLVDALPSGSYLVISHPASDDEIGVANAATSTYNQRVGTSMVRRSRSEIARFFDGLEFVEPGLCAFTDWRPDPAQHAPSSHSPALCAVARKP